MIIKTFVKLCSSTVRGPLRYCVGSMLYRQLSKSTWISPTEDVLFNESGDDAHVCPHSMCLSTAFPGESDRHNGIHVNVEQLANVGLEDFAVQLEVSVNQWATEKRSAAWLRVPIMRSALIPQAAKVGFRFHHAEGDTAVLFRWLRPDTCKIHPFATHQVGVAGCVLNPKTSQVLVVREKGQTFSSWKFPGGLSDLGENIGDTAVREVYEETGVKAVFGGVLAFRQHHRLPGAFGRSDLFFVCHMTPITFDLIPCADEISACSWIDLSELIDNTRTTAMTKHVALVARRALERGFDYVSIGCAERSSVYRNERYQLYSRLLNNVENTPDKEDYVHGVVDRDESDDRK